MKSSFIPNIPVLYRCPDSWYNANKISGYESYVIERRFLHPSLHDEYQKSFITRIRCHTRDVANPELDQIGGRFSPNRGQMIIIACRKADNMQALINRCGDTYKDSRGLIIPLVDTDFCELLQKKASKNEQAIDDLLQRRFHMIALS